MNAISNRFGLVVRRYRESRRWSQEVLADAAGLNRSYLGEVERGVAIPSLVTIAKLAQALDISLSVLIADCEAAPARGVETAQPDA